MNIKGDGNEEIALKIEHTKTEIYRKKASFQID